MIVTLADLTCSVRSSGVCEQAAQVLILSTPPDFSHFFLL